MSLCLRIDVLIRPVISDMGYVLHGVEITSSAHPIIRVYIDHPDGVSVDDCARVSRQVSTMLEVEDFFRGRYHLEVSSPGIQRPLFCIDHYRACLGSKIKFKLVRPIGGQRNFLGVIEGVDAKKEMVVLNVPGHSKSNSASESLNLVLDMIESAHLLQEDR